MTDGRLNMRSLRAPVVQIMRGNKPIQRLVAPMARYTRFVIFSRNFLWLLIIAVIALIIWTASGGTGSDDNARLVFTNVPKSGNLENIMQKPHYQGLDAKNHPYTVIADKAVQKDKDTVVLTNISADMQQDKGNWLALNAGTGELNLQTKQLLLMDGVNMFYEGGFELETDHAQVDIQKGTAYGDSKIEGHGPLGTLKAKRFEVENRGEVIRFNGSVRLKIYR